jgi:CHASE3 domain sensor protein
MFQALNLSQRILAGYVVPLLLMVAVSAIVYQQTLQLQELTAQALDAAHNVGRVKEIHTRLAQHQRDTRGYLLSGERANLEAGRTALALARQQLQGLVAGTSDADERAALGGLRAVAEGSSAEASSTANWSTRATPPRRSRFSGRRG